jgi:capsular polysaccharide transport system permease protein
MTRSSLQITASVWHALLLREAVARLFGRRWAAVWLLVEPLAGIGFLLAVYSILRARHVGGMDTLLWLSSGLLAFYLFRRTAAQGAAGIGANLALYTYRQVHPVDTIITRCFLEGLINLLIAVGVMVGLALVDIPLVADDPLLIIQSLLGLWLLGVGWGLCASVVTELVPELGNLLNLLLMPLMLISGVIFPLAAVPYPWREWMMFNPLAHGIEGVRAGISPFYHHAAELSPAYLYGWVLALVFLGLALQLRFRHRLVSL